MPEFREMFLHFCVQCGTVQANQINVRHFDAFHPTHQSYCFVCAGVAPHAPITFDLAQQKFLTRVL